MFIKKLKLENFRNYTDVTVEFNRNKILFIGKNAQGKTNLLESVYYLSTLNSFRAKNNSELIKKGADFCKICAEIIKNDTETSLEITLPLQGKKKLKVNDVAKNKYSEFAGNISVVSFTANDLLLLKGTPENRRNGLDFAIYQIYPVHADRIAKYNKIKTQKNNYLKNLKGNLNADTSVLDVWNEQLAITGANITFTRINFLYELQRIAKEKHLNISSGENLHLKYISSFLGEIDSRIKYENGNKYILDMFLKKLAEKKQEEIIRAQSVTRPHRDDIAFYINDSDAQKFASQGQQRTAVISVKLAELDMIKEKNNTDAVLLLDDVLAELDDIRQNFLLNAIGNTSQTIITSVDTLHFQDEYLKNVEIFNIKNNSVYKYDL